MIIYILFVTFYDQGVLLVGKYSNEYLHENQKLIIFNIFLHQTSGKAQEGDGMKQQQYSAGDIVYIFYRHPSIEEVANIQKVAVVNNPDNPQELALFLFETYYPLTSDMLIFTSEMDAEQAYYQYFL